MSEYSSNPSRDSSLGLIFRLNDLWSKVDFPAQKGDFNAWNGVLDRIFANLDFVDKYEAKEDAEGNITELEIDSKDFKIYKFLSINIAKAKFECKKTKTKTKEHYRARSKWFIELMKKDRWIRKFMQRQKLYLKIVEQTPESSLYGEE